MSGPQRIRSTNVADSEPEPRPVLVPATNKARPVESRKPAAKPQNNAAKPPPQETESKHKKLPSPLANMPQCVTAASILRRRDSEGLMNLSMSASCSSDASSSDSSHSRASSGRAVVGRRSAPIVRRKQCGSKAEIEKVGNESGVGVAIDGLDVKKRCAWITSNTDPCYIAFHDEEWGVPVHDDKKLFELLSLSGALAELTWPVILNKRHIFREVFLDFDPFAVSKLNEKKITMLGSPANSLLSELKLRAVIENARQICKVINEFGSFDKYMWNFVKHKPIINQFRYPRQIPVKNSKAEVISKDLVRRGFRSVGPTVIYSFMQVAGLSIDHLISCFRYQECIAPEEAGEKDDGLKAKVEEENHKVSTEMARAIDDLTISSQ